MSLIEENCGATSVSYGPYDDIFYTISHNDIFKFIADHRKEIQELL